MGYIFTRTFNHEARYLYGKRFQSTEISRGEVTQLGYDECYCGYRYISAENVLTDISLSIQELTGHMMQRFSKPCRR